MDKETAYTLCIEAACTLVEAALAMRDVEAERLCYILEELARAKIDPY